MSSPLESAPTSPTVASSDAHPRLRYVYLCSAPHSGSTLLAFLLGAHPDVATVGELAASYPAKIRCSCGQPVPACPFFAELAARAAAEGMEVRHGDLEVGLKAREGCGRYEDLFFHTFRWRWLDRLRDLAYPASAPPRRLAAERLQRTWRLARLACEIQGRRVFLDTSKNPQTLPFLACDPRFDLRTIVLHRDGRGTVNSLMRKEKRALETAVGEWLWCYRHLERVVRNYLPADRVHVVRLEDLCRDPEGVERALFRFMGVGEDAALDFSDPARFHVMGNMMRLSFDGRIRLDEKWRDELTDEEKSYIDRRIGAKNRQYGYGE